MIWAFRWRFPARGTLFYFFNGIHKPKRKWNIWDIHMIFYNRVIAKSDQFWVNPCYHDLVISLKIAKHFKNTLRDYRACDPIPIFLFSSWFMNIKKKILVGQPALMLAGVLDINASISLFYLFDYIFTAYLKETGCPCCDYDRHFKRYVRSWFEIGSSFLK